MGAKSDSVGIALIPGFGLHSGVDDRPEPRLPGARAKTHAPQELCSPTGPRAPPLPGEKSSPTKRWLPSVFLAPPASRLAPRRRWRCGGGPWSACGLWAGSLGPV